MAFMRDQIIKLVLNETNKPTPMEYPPLPPTLQTYVGMVTNNGNPKARTFYLPELDKAASKELEIRAGLLRKQCSAWLDKVVAKKQLSKIDENLKACSLPVTKSDLIDYIRNGKRIDIEQAVAMIVAYLSQHHAVVPEPTPTEQIDDFEKHDTSVLDELLNDRGVVDMLTQTCMWREAPDFHLPEDPREAAILNKKNKILRWLKEPKTGNTMPASEFTSLLQRVRRKRNKLGDSQHLTLPRELLPAQAPERWALERSYRSGKDVPVAIANPHVVSKHVFRGVQRLLSSFNPSDVTAVYVSDVERFIRSAGSISSRRLAALGASTDIYAIAYGFIAAQRRRQLKVVSDHAWIRFLVKGEGRSLLQNRPDVLTSFEDILVRRASDLVALTAVSCPNGVKDHFSTKQEIKDRARGVCELMERYVRDFGKGKMENLVFTKDERWRGGSARGPVDVYNKLCEELRDCSVRAKAVRLDLGIGTVYKFLAKDIMAHNKAWADDAFADGKVPGWVEYLARVRAEEMCLTD